MSERPRIQIEVADTSGLVKNPHTLFVIRSIQKWCDVSIGPSTELMVYSCFGERHKEFVGPRIKFIGENVRPDFDESDFVIGGDRIQHHNYLRMPMWAWNRPSRFLMKPTVARVPEQGEKFCAFVYSNPRCVPRNNLFCALNRRRFVESSGAVFNNVSGDISGRRVKNWRNSKIEYLQQFQFVVAAENSRYRGYVTEKMIDVFRAGAIPIYWGDRSVTLDFNPGSFVNANKFEAFEAVADHVVELSRDPSAMHAMRSVAPMSQKQWRRNASPHRLDMFLHRAVTSLVPRLADVPPPTETD